MLETLPFHLGLQRSGSVWSFWAPFIAGGADRLAAWGNADPFNLEPLLLHFLPVWAANGVHTFLQRFIAFVFTCLVARDGLKLEARWCLACGTAHLALSYYTFGAMLTSPSLAFIVWGLDQASRARRPLLAAAAIGLLASPLTSFVHGVPYLLAAAAGWFLFVVPRRNFRVANVFFVFALTFTACKSPQLIALLCQAGDSSRAQYPAEEYKLSLPSLFYLEPEFDLFNQDQYLKLVGIWVPLASALVLSVATMVSTGWRNDAPTRIGARIACLYGLLSLKFLWGAIVLRLASLAPWITGINLGRFFTVPYPLLAALMVALAMRVIWRLIAPSPWSGLLRAPSFVAIAILLLWPKASLWRDLMVDSPGFAALENPQLQNLRSRDVTVFRVASVLDLQPAMAYANGLETVDGWANLNSGRYRRLWLRLIEPLLQEMPGNKTIFASEGGRPQDAYIFLGTSLLNPGLGVLPGEDLELARRQGFDLNRRFRLNLLSLLNVKYVLAEQPLRGTGLVQIEGPAVPPPAICRDYATGKINFPHRRWTTALGRPDLAAWWADTREGYERKLHAPQLFIYENRNVLPRFRCVEQLHVLETSAGVLDSLASQSESSMRTVAVAARPDLAKEPASSFTAAEVALVARSCDQVQLAVSGRGDRLLVTSMVYNRYWRAKVDGGLRPVIPLNGAFFGVILTGDDKSVEFDYAPPYKLLSR